jgi:hypothetical protein
MDRGVSAAQTSLSNVKDFLRLKGARSTDFWSNLCLDNGVHHKAYICSHIQIMSDGAMYAFHMDASAFLGSLIVDASIVDDALAAEYNESVSV